MRMRTALAAIALVGMSCAQTNVVTLSPVTLPAVTVTVSDGSKNSKTTWPLSGGGYASITNEGVVTLPDGYDPKRAIAQISDTAVMIVKQANDSQRAEINHCQETLSYTLEFFHDMGKIYTTLNTRIAKQGKTAK